MGVHIGWRRARRVLPVLNRRSEVPTQLPIAVPILALVMGVVSLLMPHNFAGLGFTWTALFVNAVLLLIGFRAARTSSRPRTATLYAGVVLTVVASGVSVLSVLI